MPVFKPMKREDLLKALKGQKNVIAPIFKDNEEFFKRLSCPDCGGEVMPQVNARAPYKEGSVLPNFLGKCKSCGIEFDPHTGIQVSMPR
jgi:hypothetical protein